MRHFFKSIVEKIKHYKKDEDTAMKMVHQYQIVQHTSNSHRLKKPRTVLFVVVVILSILLAIHGIVTEFVN